MSFTERKLGSLETLLDIVHQHSDDIYTQVFILQCAETITKSKLIDATCKWVGRHPLLHAAVEIRPDSRYFVPISMDLIPSAVHWHEEVVEWTRLCEEDVQKPIDPCGIPLWRVHFAPINDGRHVMLFTVNHCIMDAQSFVSVCFELLTILNGKEDQLSHPKSLLPSMDRLLFNQDIYDGEEPELNEPWVIEDRMLPRCFTDEGVEKGTTRVIPMTFDRQTTDRLLAVSRRHGVKLTSTANCIASMALAELMTQHGQVVPENVQFGIAVSLRRHLRIDLNEMGPYTACFNCRAVLHPDMSDNRQRFWEVAKASNDELHTRLDRGEAAESFKGEAEALQGLLDHEPMPDCAFFFTSSLGVYSYGEGEGGGLEKAAVRVEEVHILMSLMEAFWMPPLFHGLATLNGRLFWTFSYHDRALKSSLAQAYCRRIKGIVEWLLDEQQEQT